MMIREWDRFRKPQMRQSINPPGSGLTFSNNPEVRDAFSDSTFLKRKRMSPEQRRKQIVRAAAKVIASKGFWGMSLQDIADEIGITESALYHYITTKNDLLGMVLSEFYDSSAADEYIYGNARGTDCDGHSVFYFPRFCLNNVLFNIQRPEMVRLFSILNAESLNPLHPAHEYFISRQHRFWTQISAMSWILPVKYRSDIARFHHLWMLSMSAMDGLQLRWLADSSADLVEEWLSCSQELFPEEEWRGYCDPAEYEPASGGCLKPAILRTVDKPQTA